MSRGQERLQLADGVFGEVEYRSGQRGIRAALGEDLGKVLKRAGTSRRDHRNVHSRADGSGELTSATLRPRVSLADESQRALADSLHDQARDVCFIARSVNFPVHHEPESPPA